MRHCKKKQDKTIAYGGAETKGRTITPLVFLIPAFLLVTIFVLYPVVSTVSLSLFQDSKFVGFNNYLELFGRRSFSQALIHNGLWILIHLPLSVFFGLLLAVLLRQVKGGAIIKSIIFLGMVIPLVVGGILFRFIYDTDAGVVNALLRFIGLGSIARSWTFYPDTALISLIIGTIWIWTGFSMIVYSAGLEGIPIELYEAAKIDGASRWKTFWRITVPMLRPATIVVVTMTLLWVLKVFDVVYVATFGGPGGASTVMAFEMYLDAFQAFNFGRASAIATILTLMTFGFAAYMVNRMAKS